MTENEGQLPMGYAPPQGADGRSSSTKLNQADLARIVLATAAGRVRLVAGIGGRELYELLDASALDKDGRLALLMRPNCVDGHDRLIEYLVQQLATIALRLWPVWYGDADFSGLRSDALGREAVRVKLQVVARQTPPLSLAWAQAAADLAMRGTPPRLTGSHWTIEIAQLCVAIHPQGLVLVFEAPHFGEQSSASAFIQTLESIAGEAHTAVVVLCPSLPPFAPPYDRVLVDAVNVGTAAGTPELGDLSGEELFELVPIRLACPCRWPAASVERGRAENGAEAHSRPGAAGTVSL